MSSLEPLCQLAGLKPNKLSKGEGFLLEAVLFVQICEELKLLYKKEHEGYFQLLNINNETEDEVVETRFIPHIINDLLSNNDYTISGIACYTQTPEDVILEVMSGLNTRPSAIFLRKLIELHTAVKPALYRSIIRKVVSEELSC